MNAIITFAILSSRTICKLLLDGSFVSINTHKGPYEICLYQNIMIMYVIYNQRNIIVHKP